MNDAGIRAAEGWIDLGNFDEAAEELHKCPPAVKSSIAFVKLWVRIYTAKGHWREVAMMCETLARHAPDDAFTIFNQAEAFHRQGRSREAFAVFQYAPLAFETGALYFYALARYLCALGQYGLALTCLGNDFDADASLRLKALEDPSLSAFGWICRRGDERHQYYPV